MEKDGPTFPWGPTFPGGGVPIAYFYINLHNLWFSRGLGSGPLPPPLDSRVASFTGFVHISFWPKDIAWHSLHWCNFCAAWVNNDRVLLFSDWRYDWGIKNAMNRVVHRVSKAFCAMGSCIIPNVGFIAIRLKGSPHQEVCEYSITTPLEHTLPLKHMNKLEDLKVL